MELSVILSGQGTKGTRDEYLPWVKELLRALLDKYVMTYAWTGESVAILRSHIAQPVVAFLQTLLEKKMLHSPLLMADLVPIQHLHSLATTLPKWGFLRTLLEHAQARQCSMSMCLMDLQSAVARLQGIYPTSFGFADYDAVLQACAFAVPSLDDLSLLLAVGGFSPEPDSGDALLRISLKQRIDGCSNARELGYVWSACKSAFVREADGVFVELLSEHLLGGSFPLIEVAAWLRSTAYQNLRAPTAAQIGAYLRNGHFYSGQFHHCVDLFELMRGSVEVSGVHAEAAEAAEAEAFRVFLRKYLQYDVKRWAHVVPLLCHGTLQRQAGTVVELLRELPLPRLNFHTTIGQLHMTELVSQVLDVTVAQLSEVPLGAPSKMLDVKLEPGNQGGSGGVPALRLAAAVAQAEEMRRGHGFRRGAGSGGHPPATAAGVVQGPLLRRKSARSQPAAA
jgi:hypothetical protein